MATTRETPDDTVPVFDKAPRTKPPFYVVGDTFHAETENGDLALPLRFKTKLVRAIRDVEGDEVDMMFALLDGIGDQDTAAALDELDIFESSRIAGTFFRAWREKQQASVGEAQRSSS